MAATAKKFEQSASPVTGQAPANVGPTIEVNADTLLAHAKRRYLTNTENAMQSLAAYIMALAYAVNVDGSAMSAARTALIKEVCGVEKSSDAPGNDRVHVAIAATAVERVFMQLNPAAPDLGGIEACGDAIVSHIRGQLEACGQRQTVEGLKAWLGMKAKVNGGNAAKDVRATIGKMKVGDITSEQAVGGMLQLLAHCLAADNDTRDTFNERAAEMVERMAEHKAKVDAAKAKHDPLGLEKPIPTMAEYAASLVAELIPSKND